MDIRKVKKLIELLEESGIAEIEITEGEESVRISRYPQGNGGAVQMPPMYMPAQAPSHVAAPIAQADTALQSPADAPVADGQAVASPMVGTFYRAASPEADPFVKPGDSVGVGDVLCIIEAMKMMNQIESEVAGTVLSVEVENGEAVEFGQVLFKIG